MRVVHLAWEYPPLVYGGIAPHVQQLAQATAAQGHQVTVVTQAHPEAPTDGIVGGVRVVRVPHHPPALEFSEGTLLTWVATLNSAMAAALVRQPRPDVVHAHDWVTAYCAALAAQGLQVPLVATFHSTERGRHQGYLPSPLARSVDEVEGWLARMSAASITCSGSMAADVRQQFGISPAVIPNGVDASAWRVDRAPDPRPLLVYVGRLEWEKGTFDLIDAMPTIRRRVPGTRLVMAGRGRQEAVLREKVKAKRLGRAVQFAGHLTHDQIGELFARAAVVVVPSRYEPFGIVALEAAAAEVPLVLARTGGLAEIACDGAAAAVFEPGDIKGLAAAVQQVIADGGGDRTAFARAELDRRFRWSTIAEQTISVYRDVTQRVDRGA